MKYNVGLLFMAFSAIGCGIGAIFGHTNVGALIGAGIGFIAIAKMSRNRGYGWFVGCASLGVGIGIAYGSSGIGALIGAGVGYLCMAWNQRRRFE